MDINSTLAAASGANGTKTAAAQGISETFDQFLTLLTTQLKHQDPLDPMDSNEFVQQLVQFAQVEQSIHTNDQLGDLLALQSEARTLGALGLIGHTVEAKSNQIALVDGSAELSYTVDENVVDTRIVITDPSGHIVRSVSGETAPGAHSFVWDGTDAAGAQLPDGAYQVTVVGDDSEGGTHQFESRIRARVTGVQTNEDGAFASLGPVSVSIDEISAVLETPPVSGG